MQRQREPRFFKQKKQTKKIKYIPKQLAKQINEAKLLAKKLQSLALYQETQTQPQVKAPQRKTISKKKTTTKQSPKKQVKELKDDNTLAQYKSFITALCQLHSVKNMKLAKQKNSFATLINQDWFKKIKTIWKSEKDENTRITRESLKNQKQVFIKKAQKITYVQNITSELLKRLKPKHWLNDEVINSYIQLMQSDILKKNENQLKKAEFPIHLMQTYYAALKMTPQKIDREIKKRNLNSKSMIVIPINEDYHWFFLVIFDQKIFIFDSILPKFATEKNDFNMAKKVYSIKDSVKKCIKLFQKIYNVEQVLMTEIELIKWFPQQDNQNDCGVMMLCGMKNVVKRFLSFKKQPQETAFSNLLQTKQFWNFCNNDMRFYRFLFARQIIQQNISVY